MKKFILTEEEKNKILNLYGILKEEIGCGEGGSSYTSAPSLSDVEKGNSKIQYKEKGDSVKEIQRLLLKLDYNLGKCKDDGLFGSKTKKAVEKFKKNNGLSDSSTVDKETLEKLKNPSSKKDSTPEPEKDTELSSTDGDYVIVKSDSYTGKDVHVFFGGAHSIKGGSSNIPYLKKVAKIVEPYTKNAIIVLTHHAKSLSNVEDFVKEKFDGKVVSIAGFSQGGKETWNHATDGSLRLVGLIDPSTYDINLSLGPNTYLVANPSNWGGKPFVDAVKKRLQWYCEHKNDPKYSGKVDCPKVSHWGFLQYFYDKFGSRI